MKLGAMAHGVGDWFTSSGPGKAAARLRADVQHFGVAKTAYEVFMEGVNLFVDFRVATVMKKERVNAEYLNRENDLQWGLLDEDQLLELAQDPANGLSKQLIRTALAKGDDCWGGLDDDVLAIHCWYATTPTDDNGLTFHFGPDYFYAYAMATHPHYRGRRLYTISGNRALAQYHARGLRGMVFTTDSHNFGARRAAAAFEVEHIGNIVAFKVGRHAWIHASEGCRRHGVGLAVTTARTQPAIAAAGAHDLMESPLE